MSGLRDIDPGIVIAATTVGPGDRIAASVAGAKYGIALLWAVAVGALRNRWFGKLALLSALALFATLFVQQLIGTVE